MKHYIRDLELAGYETSYDDGVSAVSFAIYHFLKNAGWTWIWECDGELTTPGHCPDGNMDDSGTTSWTVSSTGVLAKNTVTKHMAWSQSLKWTSAAAGSETLQSANFTNLTDGRTYQQVVWFYNNTGQPYTLDVFDGNAFGSGVEMPSNGAWTSYRVTFDKNAAGSAYFRITAPAGASYVAYLDSCMTFESFFEYNTAGLLADYSDGVIAASNLFSSASYAFSAADIGRHVVIWDTTNLGNSGVYEISSVAAPGATLDFRAGGSETLTAQSSLKWRLIDVAQGPKTAQESSNESGCGWGLQSPHSQKMRLFMRHRMEGSTYDQMILYLWASPEDASFDVLDGNFYDAELSSLRKTSNRYSYSNTTSSGLYHWIYQYTSGTQAAQSRLYLMTDDDGSFVTAYHRKDLSARGCFLVGYTGAVADYSTIETWCFCASYNIVAAVDYAYPVDDSYRTFYRCITVIGDYIEFARMVIYGCVNNGIEFITMSSAKANPFDSEEWLQPFILLRNQYGYSVSHGEKECDIGMFWARQNLSDFVTISSDNYFVFPSGMTWEWPGISVIA